jgi:hypothetical protein
MPMFFGENLPHSLSEVRLGTTLSRIEKLPPHNWVFHFGDGIRLSVEAPWRVLSHNSILVTREKSAFPRVGGQLERAQRPRR